jgi:hypothetical protein
MSALPPIADIAGRRLDVRFVPERTFKSSALAKEKPGIIAQGFLSIWLAQLGHSREE